MSRPILKSHRKGRVGNDGNGMVGGSWEAWVSLGFKDIETSELVEGIEDSDLAEKCLEWLKERLGETFRVEAYISHGYDKSVGVDAYFALNESLDCEEAESAINDLPYLAYDEKCALRKRLWELQEDDDYELYDLD